MTTPRDDIAGLSERLAHRLGVRTVTVGPGLYEDVSAAVTQLDSLIKERDALRNEINDWANEVARYKSYAEKFDQENAALQARVKELGELRDLYAEHSMKEEDCRKMWQARALRAEQERDSLASSYESLCGAATILGDRSTRLQQERDEAYERAAKVAEKEEPGWRGVCIAAEIRRLASGPEKEG